MFDAINNVVGKINGVVWGWPMIILLFGTHVFLTIRTGFIQRKTISKGIKFWSIDNSSCGYHRNR